MKHAYERYLEGKEGQNDGIIVNRADSPDVSEILRELREEGLVMTASAKDFSTEAEYEIFVAYKDIRGIVSVVWNLRDAR